MRAGKPRGFTFVAVLLLLALIALGLGAAVPRVAHQGQREREQELLRVGMLYARALRDYHDASPGARRHYPRELAELLVDTRFVGTRRHLRELYPDPMQPHQPWGLLRDADGRIFGVHSVSTQEPIARAPRRLDDRVLPAAARYSDWHFLADPPP